MAGIVTALKQQSKNRNRVNVHLDGTFAFGTTKVLAASLKIGQELSNDHIAKLKGQEIEDATYQRALGLISRRPRSEYELRVNFNRHEVPSAVQEAVLKKLREISLVDDRVFAEAWVENRRQFRPRSAFALKVELRKKGVAAEDIEAALNDYDDEQAAYQAAMMKAHRWQGSDWEDFRKRLGAYLARRGFRYSMISPVVARVWNETAGVDDESEVFK